MSDHPCNVQYSDTPTFEKVPKHEYGTEWRTDVISAEDWLGHRFSVGEKVMYCIGAGRGQMMAIGVVQRMRARDYPSKRFLGAGQGWGEYTRVDVEVQVLTQKTSGNWDNEARTKPAWVNPMNITALPEWFL